jgi:hypothetical protein
MSQSNRFKTSHSAFNTRYQVRQELKTPLTSTTNQDSPPRPTIPQEIPPSHPPPQTALLPVRNSSLNLFSIISKFEALDAVSLPYRVPALQPAPLQVSHNSARKTGGTGATGQLRKLSIIFSPENKTPVSRKSQNEPQENTHPRQERESIFTEDENTGTIKKSAVQRSSWRNRTRKNLSPRKSRSSLLGSGMGRSRSGSPVKKGLGAWSVGQMEVEGTAKKRGRSIKDMIRFYDGGTSLPPYCAIFL